MRYLPLLAIVQLACLVSAAAQASENDNTLTLLPQLPKPKPATITIPPTFSEISQGVQVAIGSQVVLTGTIIRDEGPGDGLEVLACLATGKNHESLVRLDAVDGQLVKAAFIAALGLNDGMPASEGTGHPGRGTPLRVVLEWEDPVAPGNWYTIDASSLMRDRATNQAYPPLPFTYTGSRILALPDGNGKLRSQFMLDNTKSIVAVADEPDALFASPSPVAGLDHRTEVNSAISPPVGTKVRLLFSKTSLPLTLALDAAGALSMDGAVLDDAALDIVLAKHFGSTALPHLRAVGVQVDSTMPRKNDLAARSRLLASAARAHVWVVPVFVLISESANINMTK